MASTKTLFQDSNIVGFLVVILLLIAIAVGQLYVIAGLDSIHFGIPMWVYVMLLLLGVMLGLAWLAIDIIDGRRW